MPNFWATLYIVVLWRTKGRRRHGLMAVTGTSSPADAQWFIVGENVRKDNHPRYTQLDDDVGNRASNILLAYLLPIGHLAATTSVVWAITGADFRLRKLTPVLDPRVSSA